MIERSFTITSLIRPVLEVIFAISFLTALVFMGLGLFGLLASLIKHTDKDKGLNFLKRGFIILFVTVILFVITNIILMAIGLGPEHSIQKLNQ